MSPHGRAVAYSVIVALGGLIFGLDAVLISGGVDQIRTEFGLSDFGLGFVVSAPGLGVLVLLPFAGIVCNSFGRKATLLGVALLYVISAVWSAFAADWIQLAIARLLGGLAFSSLSIGPMYIAEIAPSRWRGKLVTVSQINTVIDLSGAYFINLAIINATESGAGWADAIGMTFDNSWRYMLGSEVLPAVFWFCLLFAIPKSPRWLVSQGRDEAARSSLQQIAPAELVEEQLEEIRQGLQNETRGLPVWNQVRRLAGPELRVAVIVGATIAIAQQATGINAVYFYAPTVFKQLGYGVNAASVQAAVMGLVSLLFAVLALAVVDRFGRRPVVVLGFLWIIASLAMCAYGFSLAEYRLEREDLAGLPAELDAERLAPMVGEVFSSDTAFKRSVGELIGTDLARQYESPLLEAAVDLPAGLIVAGVLSFIAAFQFSVGPVMWVLLSEIFPTAVRGVAIPLFHFVTGAASYVVQLLFPVALSTFGASAVFGSFIAIPAIGLLVLWAFLPETKNLSIEEIQAAFRAGRSASTPASTPTD